ncbi:MAG: RAD55 family ATPase [Sulfolobales archaeon]
MTSNDLFNNILDRLGNGLICISGDVGTDKTVLASMIAHRSVFNGNRSLYISFRYDKEELYMLVKKYNANLEEIEAKNVFSFIRIPLMLPKDNILEVLSNILSEYIIKRRYNVVVFDPITALFDLLDNFEVNALINNFISELAKVSNNKIVTVYDKEPEADLGYKPDVLIEMKTKIINNSVFKELRIKSYRDNTNIYSIPYILSEGLGFTLFIPPQPSELVSSLCDNKQFKNPCNVMQGKIGNICPGDILYIKLPNLKFIGYPLTYLIISALYNKLRLSIITHLPKHYLSSQLLKASKSILRDKKISPSIEKLIGSYVRIEPLTPTSFITDEIIYRTLRTLAEFKPDIITFTNFYFINPTATQSTYYTGHEELLVKIVMYLKNMGVVSVLFDEESVNNSIEKLIEPLADISIKSTGMRRFFRKLLPKFVTNNVRIDVQKDLTLKDFISCSKDLKNIIDDLVTTI